MQDDGILGGVALKFPAIRKSFKHVKAAFEAHTSTKEVTVEKLLPILKSMGATHLTAPAVNKLFTLSDLDGSKAISWREFLIVTATGYYLRPDRAPSPNADQSFAEIMHGFMVCHRRPLLRAEPMG